MLRRKDYLEMKALLSALDAQFKMSDAEKKRRAKASRLREARRLLATRGLKTENYGKGTRL